VISKVAKHCVWWQAAQRAWRAALEDVAGDKSLLVLTDRVLDLVATGTTVFPFSLVLI
jgi:hypothetical protein